MIRTQIYLDETQRRRLAALAAQEGENMSELIREAVDNYLACAEKQMRERGKLGTRLSKLFSHEGIDEAIYQHRGYPARPARFDE